MAKAKTSKTAPRPDPARLARLRGRIDGIDEGLVSAIVSRMGVAAEIGRLKHSRGVGAFAPAREREVLRRVSQLAGKARLPARAARAIFREIMSCALALEGGLVVACPATPGHLALYAARRRFGEALAYRECATAVAVVQAVVRGRADYGVLAPEALLGLPDALRTGVSLVTEIASREPRADYLVVGRRTVFRDDGPFSAVLIRGVSSPAVLKRLLKGLRCCRMTGPAGSLHTVYVDFPGGLRDAQVRRVLARVGRKARSIILLGGFTPDPLEQA